MRWLNTYQIRVNDLCGSEGLVFTAEIWRDNNNKTNKITKLTEKINIVEGKYFPFLDISIFWNFHNGLSFKIYMKPNQKLKYLNKGSCHTNKCFEAISNGVFGRLSKLTTKCEKTMNSRLDKLYPDHANALKHAGIAPATFPKMKEIIAKLKLKKESKDKSKEKRRPRDKFTFVSESVIHGRAKMPFT